MKILFLSHYFPPEINAPASRTFDHCREWVRLGHSVTVVTCAPNHPRGRIYEGYENRFFQRESIDGIDVIRLWTFLTANEGFFLRTLNYVSYFVACVMAAPVLPRADVVVSTSPQFFNGLAGFFVSRMKRSPWILEIRDLWPESIVALGAIRNQHVIRLLQCLESFAYKKADAIVPVTDSFERYMIDKGVDKQKIVVIKNGVELGLFRHDASGDALRDAWGLYGKTVVAYFGTHGMAHHLETVLETAALMRERSDVVFLLVGDGAEKDRLLAMGESMGLANVVMKEQQPKHVMPQLWAVADVSLVVLKRSSLFQTVIPSKIFEAMAMGVPIVLGVEGEALDLVSTAGAGLGVEPENPGALAVAVTELVDNPQRRIEMGRKGREFVREHFDRKVLANRFLDLMATLVTSKK